MRSIIAKGEQEMKGNKRENLGSNRKTSVTILWMMVIAIFLAVGMAGCSSAEPEQAAEETTASPATEQNVASAETKEETTAKQTAKKADAKESGTTETAQTTRATTQTEKQSAAAKKSETAETAKKQTRAKKEDTKDQKKANKTKNPTKKTAAKETKKATKANVCYVTVEGYCSGKSVSLQGGDTAYSVLKRSGASVSAENSAYGVYVKGINGRFEFDEGPSSGWKYSVNGTSPNKAADKCSVSKGDTVKWYYVK